MSKHSKNNTASSVFTYGERQMIKDFGTIKDRLGQNSQKLFYQCSLCLLKVNEPLACDEGHMFCKQCALENLVQQQKQNQILLELWEKEQLKIQIDQQQTEKNEKLKELENFDKLEGQFNPQQRKQLKIIPEKLKTIQELQEEIKNPAKRISPQTVIQKTENSFWLYASKDGMEQKSIIDKELMKNKEKPSQKLMCPASKDHIVKLKKLYKVDILFIDGEAQCHACRKQLQFQKIAMSKVCGHVMCKKCFEQTSIKTNICGICCIKFNNKNDIIYLQESHSAFVSHNQVEATKYIPSLGV